MTSEDMNTHESMSLVDDPVMVLKGGGRDSSDGMYYWLLLLVVALLCVGNSCAALRQHGEQARAATASVIEAPQRVEAGATVTEALGAALTANIEKTDRLEGIIATKIGGDGDSVALWIALILLGGGDLFGHIWNVIDRRLFHRNGSESKGIVR